MTTITLTLLRTLLKERPADGHKGTFGQALLIAGQWGMGGASILAARAALAAGVGKVCVCLPRRNNDILQVAVPEAVLVHDPSETHFTQAVDPAPFSAVAAGPALGTRDDSAQALRSQCVLATGKPLLLDADALNILARHPEWTKDVADGTVITPHGGEWQRLIEAGADLSRFIIVKKGHPTLILPPGDDESEAYVCPWGNNGMATAGSGDVLTGIIVSLMAQGYAPWEATLLGVSLHALAGDAARDALGEHSVTASALVNFLPAAFKTIRNTVSQ